MRSFAAALLALLTLCRACATWLDDLEVDIRCAGVMVLSNIPLITHSMHHMPTCEHTTVNSTFTFSCLHRMQCALSQ